MTTDAILKRIFRSRMARNAFRHPPPAGHIAELCKQAKLTEEMLLELDAIAGMLCSELERARHVHETSAFNYAIQRYKDFTK